MGTSWEDDKNKKKVNRRFYAWTEKGDGHFSWESIFSTWY